MTSVIPLPDKPTIVTTARHQIAAVRVGTNNVIVIDDTETYMFFASSGHAPLSATALDDALRLRDNEIPGTIAVTAIAECDATIDDGNPESFVVHDDTLAAIVLAAIPHLYDNQDDTMTRKMYRAIYTRLTKHVTNGHHHGDQTPPTP